MTLRFFFKPTPGKIILAGALTGTYYLLDGAIKSILTDGDITGFYNFVQILGGPAYFIKNGFWEFALVIVFHYLIACIVAFIISNTINKIRKIAVKS